MLKPLMDIKLILLGCLTIGLAPFTPEPHIWGKLKWVAGGAVGMKPIDWGDLIMHGFPWVLLIIWTILAIKQKFFTPKQQ